MHTSLILKGTHGKREREGERAHLKLLPHGIVLVGKLTEHLQRANVLVLCSGSGA